MPIEAGVLVRPNPTCSKDENSQEANISCYQIYCALLFITKPNLAPHYVLGRGLRGHPYRTYNPPKVVKVSPSKDPKHDDASSVICI